MFGTNFDGRYGVPWVSPLPCRERARVRVLRHSVAQTTASPLILSFSPVGRRDLSPYVHNECRTVLGEGQDGGEPGSSTAIGPLTLALSREGRGDPWPKVQEKWLKL